MLRLNCFACITIIVYQNLWKNLLKFFCDVSYTVQWIPPLNFYIPKSWKSLYLKNWQNKAIGRVSNSLTLSTHWPLLHLIALLVAMRVKLSNIFPSLNPLLYSLLNSELSIHMPNSFKQTISAKLMFETANQPIRIQVKMHKYSQNRIGNDRKKLKFIYFTAIT